MVNSYMKKADSSYNAPMQSFDFVLNKFKVISVEYWISLLIGIITYIFLYIEKIDVFQKIMYAIPEIMGITNCGVAIQEINAPTWYISAMLISMLPLYYILCKNKDFFIYIFSPLAALLLYGFMYNQDKMLIDRLDFYGIIMGGLIRAVCGICFGVIAYIIFSKISSWCKTNKQRILFTITEILLYLLFFIAWFAEKTTSKTMYGAMLLLPIAIAITFSGKSYVSELFKFSVLKYLSSISLAIFLNHWAARMIVRELFKGESYKKSFALMMGITVLLCIVYYILVHIIKNIINKKRVKNDSKI